MDDRGVVVGQAGQGPRAAQRRRDRHPRADPAGEQERRAVAADPAPQRRAVNARPALVALDEGAKVGMDGWREPEHNPIVLTEQQPINKNQARRIERCAREKARSLHIRPWPAYPGRTERKTPLRSKGDHS